MSEKPLQCPVHGPSCGCNAITDRAWPGSGDHQTVYHFQCGAEFEMPKRQLDPVYVAPIDEEKSGVWFAVKPPR